MFRAGRRVTAVEHLSPSGVPVRLTGEVWWVALAVRWGGGALAYHRPSQVVSGETRARIIDHVMLIRIAAVVLLGAALLRRITS